MQIPDLPFTVLALSPLTPLPESGYSPRMIDVDLATLDEVLEKNGPMFYVPLPKDLCPDAGVTIEITSMRDFKPISLLKKIPYLARVSEAVKFIAQAFTSGKSAQGLAQEVAANWPDLPLQVTVPGFEEAKTADTVDDILSMVAAPGGEKQAAASSGSHGLKEQAESLLSSLLAAIFDNEDFRTFEASWRGVETLLRQGPVKDGQGAKLRVVSVNLDHLEAALEKLSVDLENELPNLVLIDLPFDSTPGGIELIEEVAGFADDLLSPTALWIGPEFLNLKDWTELKKVNYIKHYMEDAAFAKWRKLPEAPGSAWLGVTMNRFLTRFPYGEGNPAKGAHFQEEQPLWISPVWALGALAVQSTIEYGWPSRFTDYAHIAVHDLALNDFGADKFTVTELALAEDRLLEFVEAGITPLLGPLRKDMAILPKETTVAGGSLKLQMFTSRILGFFFWCQENLEREFGPDLPGVLKATLARYWEKTGHAPPDDLEIEAGRPLESGSIPLTVTLTPPATVLPGRQRLEFTFAW